MEEDELRELCRNFCHYYKPEKKKEIKCRGYLVVKQMMDKGRDLSFDRTETILDDDTIGMLSEKLCRSCSFYEHDCDFAAHIKSAPPCGGFIFLATAIINKIIVVEDVDCL